MISKTFISRPKFALVISIVITIAGLISMSLLPVNMYPQITPPQVQISASYQAQVRRSLKSLLCDPLKSKSMGLKI